METNVKQTFHLDYWKSLDKSSDRSVEIILWAYLGFGFILSLFYATYLVGFVVGPLSIAMYFTTKGLFKTKNIHHYVASLVLGIFMAQFIYQMHGLFEMHFAAFIGLIVLLTYQNWKTVIPISIFIVVHHTAFAYIQYIGFIREDVGLQNIYFTQLDYMDFTTFLFHASLYTSGAVIAGFYAFFTRKSTDKSIVMLAELNTFHKQTERNTDFAKEIANFNFDAQFEIDKDDTLAMALSEMREELKNSKLKEEQDKFFNQGMAKVGDIIRRTSNDGLSEMANSLLAFLVKYLNANQGALFFIEDSENDQEELVMRACYAYDRKKYLSKSIKLGEGIVGQCFFEKEPIILKEVPLDYINITSGLGDAPPNCLLVIPLKSEDKVLGVLEIASFKEFENDNVVFLEKAGESIAMALQSAKLNTKTSNLLTESQKREEEMRSQEEELRQNLEEMTATQEALHRKNLELQQKEQEYDELTKRLEQIEGKKSPLVDKEEKIPYQHAS